MFFFRPVVTIPDVRMFMAGSHRLSKFIWGLYEGNIVKMKEKHKGFRQGDFLFN